MASDPKSAVLGKVNLLNIHNSAYSLSTNWYSGRYESNRCQASAVWSREFTLMAIKSCYERRSVKTAIILRIPLMQWQRVEILLLFKSRFKPLKCLLGCYCLMLKHLIRDKEWAVTLFSASYSLFNLLFSRLAVFGQLGRRTSPWHSPLDIPTPGYEY